MVLEIYGITVGQNLKLDPVNGKKKIPSLINCRIRRIKNERGFLLYVYLN